MNKDDKLKALDAAITQIEKSYGKGSIMKLGDSGTNMNIETVPTGSISLDIALGLGGVPKGRVIEIYGPESSGKTTVALHMVAEVQKRGGIAGFIDAEHALDPVYAKNIGVDMIPVDADFSKYKIVVAPVLYMVKDGMKEARENFVKNGGILITTFMSGIVGQSDNVYLGGYPGPLREMAGVWVEEIDALAPEQKNKAKFADGSTAACGLLCDLMHLEGAKALASYEEDFYAGMPAASKNTYGKGTTYYIATQFEEEGLAKILDQAVQEAGVSSVIPEETGLEVVTRVSDTTRFYFVMNFTDEKQILPESLTGKKDMISQKMTEHGMKLKKWDVLLLEEHL